MAARPIATAYISFGLVNIPVRLFSASQSSESISFHMLHQKCGTRLKQQYICPKDNEVVERDDTVKGYEYSKDQYVLFSQEELKAVEEEATKTIAIGEFVPQEKVDTLHGNAYPRSVRKAPKPARACAMWLQHCPRDDRNWSVGAATLRWGNCEIAPPGDRDCAARLS